MTQLEFDALMREMKQREEKQMDELNNQIDVAIAKRNAWRDIVETKRDELRERNAEVARLQQERARLRKEYKEQRRAVVDAICGSLQREAKEGAFTKQKAYLLREWLYQTIKEHIAASTSLDAESLGVQFCLNDDSISFVAEINYKRHGESDE